MNVTTVSPIITDDKPIEDQAFWEHHFKQILTSGMSRAAYCRSHDLNYDRAQYWYKKLHPSRPAKLTSDKPKKIIPVKIKPSPSSPSSPSLTSFCRIDCGSDTSVNITSEAAFQLLLQKVFH